MLKDKGFMQQLNNLTHRNGIDYLHRQIATIPNGLHQNIHMAGWNADFKKWAKGMNGNFSLKDLQKQIKLLMREYNIPKSSRNFAKRYGAY